MTGTPAKARLARLLSSTSVELSPGDGKALALLGAYFEPGTAAHITFLPNEKPARIVETAVSLRRAGFVPIPHIAARTLLGADMLDDLLARAAGEAGVDGVLLIGGDADRPRGPFSSSLDVLKSGLLQKHGVRSVAFAGHPEGHPAVAPEIMAAALRDKVRFALAEGLSVRIVNQLCFEADPLIRWLADLRQDGIAVPVRFGVASPTSVQAMLRFAARCGVGASVRALWRRSSTVAHLLADAAPDALLQEMSEALSDADMTGVEGLHFFVFGGLRKLGEWLGAHDQRRPAAMAQRS